MSRRLRAVARFSNARARAPVADLGGDPFPRCGLHQIGLGQSLLEPHEKNGPVLLQNVASTALGTQASGWFIGGTRKERRCFAAERGPDPFEHTRALEGPFFDPNPRARTSALAFIGATRKDRPCFAAERGLDRLGHTSLRMVYWRHTKGTALFCCRTRPRPL